MGGSPGLVVMGDDSCSECPGLNYDRRGFIRLATGLSHVEKISDEIQKVIYQLLLLTNLGRLRGAAIAQWIRLRLPSCRPGFESQANHLSFYFIYSQICAIFVIVL